jgi:hypothetical protein
MRYIMLKHISEPDKPQMTIRRMRLACWITKTTHTETEYILLITFPRQQWFLERNSMFSYAYVASLVLILKSLVFLTLHL